MITSSAGFKLDTLLKLSDVKGVDRKTSLLHFVVASLLKRHSDRPGGIATLSAQLSAVKPAANLQASVAPQPPRARAPRGRSPVSPYIAHGDDRANSAPVGQNFMTRRGFGCQVLEVI